MVRDIQTSAVEANFHDQEPHDGDGGDDDDPSENNSFPTQQDAEQPPVYPTWLTDLHNLAQEKCIHLLFSNQDVTQATEHAAFSTFVEWS